MTEPAIDLAEIGVCPRCRAGLARDDARAFSCRGCGARWPVIGGIPRFVESELYVSSFGWEWRRHRKTQIDSQTRRESEATFREKTGLTPDDVRGKRVLDIGVGTGRFLDVVARWGGIPVGIDLSLAVLTARRNLDARTLVAQANLFHLPFKEESFDIVYSIGVLHHTPSTRDALRKVARFVKPGGRLCAAVYERHADSYDFSRRYRRWTTAMSPSLLHFLSHAAIPQHHAIVAVEELLPRYVAHQVRRVLPVSEHRDPLWRVLDTFDWYSPRYQWLHDEAEVLRWFEELGFQSVARMPERSMVSVHGVRPRSGPLATPPPSPSSEHDEDAPRALPAIVEDLGPLKDPALLALLAGEVALAQRDVVRALARIPWNIALRPLWYDFLQPRANRVRGAITATVVSAKRALGIERDIIPQRPARDRAGQGKGPAL